MLTRVLFAINGEASAMQWAGFDDGARWNGFLEPLVTLDTATGIVAWHESLPAAERQETLTIDGSEIVRTSADDDVTVRLRPDAHGLYRWLSGWTWEVLGIAESVPYHASDVMPAGVIEVGSRVRVPRWSQGSVIEWCDGIVTEIYAPSAGLPEPRYIVSLSETESALYFPYSIGRHYA